CSGSSSLASGSTCSIANRRTASRIARRSSVAYALGSVVGAAGRRFMVMSLRPRLVACQPTSNYRIETTRRLEPWMPPFDPTGFRLARKGNQFEDFEVGQVWTHHWGRTITPGDNAIFSTATCHWSPMYLNAEYARAHDHPDTVVNPMLALCVAVGLSVEDLSEGGGPFLGVEECRFYRPIYPGDTLTARSTVLATIQSRSHPEAGIVTWHTEAHDQRGELVLDFKRSNLVARRRSA